MGLWDTPADPTASVFGEDFVPPTREALAAIVAEMKRVRETPEYKAEMERRLAPFRPRPLSWEFLHRPLCTHPVPFR